MSINVTVRSLNGETSVTLDEGASVADVREAAEVAAGITLRSQGQRVEDEAGTTVQDNDVLIGTPPDAKHGS